MGTWLSVIAIAIGVAALAAATPRLLWQLDLRRRHETGIEQARAADRAAILRRVRDKWIGGVLEPSLAHAERLTLDLIRDGGGTLHGAAAVLQLFLQSGGGLLILGPPGAGKTTLLLEVADAMLQRAESDRVQPVPVVASLAAWTGRHQSLAAWLTGELAESYRIPRATAQAWARRDDLVILLDGLDEVGEQYREACAEAIGRHLREHPFSRMAVCCRTEYAALVTGLPEVVELQPPGPAQVDAYLARLETTWTPLADIRTALTEHDQLRRPLMIKVAALAYRGRTPPAARPGPAPRRPGPEWPQELAEMFAPTEPEPTEPQPIRPGPAAPYGLAGDIATARAASRQPAPNGGAGASATAQRAGESGVRDHDGASATISGPGVRAAAFWDAYLARMLGHRALAAGHDYGQDAARAWLTALAVRLRDSGQDELNLDRLVPATRRAHDPSSRWRQVGRELRVEADTLAHTAGAKAAGLIGYLGLPELARKADTRASRARPGTWLGSLPEAVVRQAEETGWWPGRVPDRPAWTPVIGVLALPVLTTLVAALTSWVFAWFVALACGLLWGLNLARRAGQVPRPSRSRPIPNAGIRRSARRAAVLGVVAAVGFWAGLALTAHVLVSTFPGTAVVMTGAVLAGLGCAVSCGGGACARHYLARVRLARAGATPWRYKSFLESMTERGLLLRTGTGYRFIHRGLRDHLAGLAGGRAVPIAFTHEPAHRADQPSPQRVPHRAQ
jgi:NACHT domain